MSYNKVVQPQALLDSSVGILPTKWNYGKYSSDNYGSHTQAMSVFGITFFYSYSTVVAFSHYSVGTVTRENDWGPTTGKHLGWIRGRASRWVAVGQAEFAMRLYNLMVELGVIPKTTQKKFPKSMQILETGEIIDGRKNPDTARTPERTWARKEKKREARERKQAKREAIRKRKETFRIARLEKLKRHTEELRRQQVRERMVNERLVVSLEEGVM